MSPHRPPRGATQEYTMLFFVTCQDLRRGDRFMFEGFVHEVLAFEGAWTVAECLDHTPRAVIDADGYEYTEWVPAAPATVELDFDLISRYDDDEDSARSADAALGPACRVL